MKRIYAIDYLKTIGIIGVLLFHVGLVNNGYLGVEVFFVISGFLMIKAINKSVEENSFNPLKYIFKRVATFWPLVAIAGVLSLGVGYYCMLPDDYENLAESVIASNAFSNNILQAITTKNYWNVVNTYKPLMHTWYIGVLVQAIVFISILLWVASRISKKNGIKNTLILLTVVSLIAYCLPVFSNSDKFYFFPFRLFEITIGCLIPYFPNSKISRKTLLLVGNIGILLIVFFLFAGITMPREVGLLTVVLSSVLVIWSHGSIGEDYGINEKAYRIITLPGRYSFDVYVWHQIAIAFLYYSVFQTLNVALVFLVIAITAVLSALTIVFRKKVTILSGVGKRIIFSLVFVVIGCALSGYIYMNAGVVRDVPELGIDKTNVHRNMHAEYVDIPFSWDVDFEDEQKIHILVLGDSFGRDFANILNESQYSDQFEISYIYYIYGSDISDKKERVEQADFVIYASSGWKIPEELAAIPSEKLYVAGNKSFGNSNGIIYVNRNKEWYFDQRVDMPDDMILHNNALKGVYGDHYIDMISPLLDEDEQIQVFTDDHFYISQDCRHLTKQGAQYYSRILDLEFLLQKRQ